MIQTQIQDLNVQILNVQLKVDCVFWPPGFGLQASSLDF